VFSPDYPLIVQADGSILVDAHHARYDEARTALAPYAELVSAPEHVHTYRLSAVSVWNALAMGRTAEDVKIDVGRFSRYGIPPNVLANVDGWCSRFGRIRLETADDGLLLVCTDALLAREIASSPKAAKFLVRAKGDRAFELQAIHRGEIKWALVKLGYPVDDHAGFAASEPLEFAVRDGDGFEVRDYQRAAAETFLAAGTPGAGHGVIVLPCGAGKTLVGICAAARVGANTLVLCTSDAAVQQWEREFKARTDLPRESIGTYTGTRKDVRPVTIATYSVLTHRRDGEFKNLALFSARAFGLVIYDEVHLLPAPVFRMTASLQAVRRLGLTATLLREDGREDDVFALIGPKRYDVPWKVLERRCFIATAECAEIRVPMADHTRIAYANAEPVERFRIAAESDAKEAVVRAILARHPGRQALVMGTYVMQLQRLARYLDAPIVTGETSEPQREAIYDRFRRGEIPCLVISRVGSFALDLPCASVAVEVAGTFGSRQEEAQRLGRILRPKEETALFYTVVSTDTVEQDFALRRQRFLAEQGYRYRVEDWVEPAAPAPDAASPDERTA
jgi:DNA excision repair protein ERCC-3